VDTARQKDFYPAPWLPLGIHLGAVLRAFKSLVSIL
jgi:hypothetical protein